jgi:hypothetical protein
MSLERLMDEKRILLNLCESYQQEAFLDYCTQGQIKVVFLDNLSILC